MEANNLFIGKEHLTATFTLLCCKMNRETAKVATAGEALLIAGRE
jgi:hypothetical protein